MTTPWVFASGLAATVALSFVVVAYLRQPLQQILIELCGQAIGSGRLPRQAGRAS